MAAAGMSLADWTLQACSWMSDCRTLTDEHCEPVVGWNDKVVILGGAAAAAAGLLVFVLKRKCRIK